MNRFGIPAAAVLFFVVLTAGWAQQAPEMQLMLLGTGYPFPSPERAGPSCAIIAEDKIFVIDSGRGAGMRLATLGNPWKNLSAVFITHLHSDHIDGLPDVFHNAWEFGGGTPFELYGPEGTKKSADGILQFYDADIHIRRDLTEKLPAEGARINVHEIKEGVIYDKSGVQVTAFQVEHPPVASAFGYRFDSGSHSIVITGDTRPNPNLVKFASGADILVSEAYVPDRGASAKKGDRPWSSIQDYHMSAKEAGETAEKAKVKILVLTHLIPANAPEKAFLDEAGKVFNGKILVGRDLMRVSASEK